MQLAEFLSYLFFRGVEEGWSWGKVTDWMVMVVGVHFLYLTNTIGEGRFHVPN